MKRNNYVLVDKKSIFIDKRVKLGDNVIIYENNRIEGECTIGDNVTIFPGCFLINSSIGKGAKIYSSFIENSKIGARCIVGSFSCLRKVNSENGVMISACSNLKAVTLTKDKGIS